MKNDNIHYLFLKAIVLLIVLYITLNIIVIFQKLLYMISKRATTMKNTQMKCVKHLLFVVMVKSIWWCVSLTQCTIH